MPVRSPPVLSTASALPARAKPIAAPGITACERTSATRPIPPQQKQRAQWTAGNRKAPCKRPVRTA